MIPALANWSASPDPGLHAEQDEVGAVGDLGLGLADADGLDDHPVEEGPRQNDRREGRVGEAAEPAAGGHRADEGAGVGGIGRDADAVAEERAARPPRRGVDGDDGDRLPARPPGGEKAPASVDFPTPGGPVRPSATPRGACQAASRSATRAGSSGASSRAVRQRASAGLPPEASAARSAGSGFMPRRPAPRRAAPGGSPARRRAGRSAPGRASRRRSRSPRPGRSGPTTGRRRARRRGRG